MVDSGLPRAESPPPLSDSTAADKGGQQFATFEMKRPETLSQDGNAGRRSTDDRTPLNPNREPSIRSNSTGRQPYTPNEPPLPMPMNGMPAAPVRQPSRDQYGNPLPQQSGAMYGDLPPPELRHQGSRGSLGSNGSRGGAVRGRGGYGPPSRGYGPPRGGYGPPRGGPGPRGGYRGQGPPPGWNGRGRGGVAPGGMGGRGGMQRPGPPPGYGSYGSSRSGPPPPPPPAHIDYGAPHAQDEFVAGSMIGQAIEMDERTGASPAPDPQRSVQPPYGLHGSEGDAVAMHHPRHGPPSAPGPQRTLSGDGQLHSPTSMYSEHQTYAPPRSQWHEDQPNLPTPEPAVSPLGEQHDQDPYASGLPSSQVLPHVSPVAARASPAAVLGAARGSGGADKYYEDVDPRFAVDPASETGALPHPENALPYALTPGGLGGYAARERMPPSSPHHLHPSSVSPPYGPAAALSSDLVARPTTTDTSHSSRSLDDPLPPGARSPPFGDADSDTSHFTSVSQRGINPNWRGSQAGGGGSMAAGHVSSASAVQRRREDVILTANPDFSLPGMMPGRGGVGGARGAGGAAGGAGGLRPQHSRMGSATLGLTPPGRYPTDI
nr:ph-response regulator protein pali/rim9 [Quercus suber]